jgi:transposase
MAEIEGQPRQPEPRRSFTEEFKREAVRLAIERGNVSAVARDLGVNESVLSRWKRQLPQEAGQPGPGTRPLKQENEILKKAVGIFTSRPA